jgi:hypothetical protein
MTNGDFQFMKEMGIESCTLDDPSPSSLPPPLPTEALIPKLTEKDARWLQNLSVMWEQEPELGFVPPRCLWEYLSGYPNGIREAVGEAVKSLEVSLSDDDLDDLAQDIVAMFLDFAQDLEDIVEMYPLQPPMRPGRCQSEQFREYVTLRVMAGMLAMLHTNPAGMDDFGECLGF